MKLLHVIYSVIIILLLLTVGCISKKRTGAEAEQQQATEDALSGGSGDKRGYDPLEFPQDRAVVPRENAQPGVIRGRLDLSKPDTLTEDSALSDIVGLPNEIDSVNSQSYRIQIFTGKVYGEAQKELRIAEEIFDRPVFVDYEVPNFKVRVGNFADRDEAEEYQQRVKAAGYSTAWVVMVTVNIQQAVPLYEDAYPIDNADSLSDESGDDNSSDE
ncbi:MAG: SPOR domain-containing protein [bacterium]|nr:SPOR domain-containing protein [bacterium]